MLIKCKSCNSEYMPEGMVLPRSGIEFECSECGEKWLEIPKDSTDNKEQSETISENEIVEPSVLMGKNQGFKEGEVKSIPISTLAKQELVVQRGGKEAESISEMGDQIKENSKNRVFEWVAHKDSDKEKKGSDKAKSFETLTNPKSLASDDYQNDETTSDSRENSGFNKAYTHEEDESINPKLVQRIKEVEKNQSNDKSSSDEPDKQASKGKVFLFIILGFFLICIGLGATTKWSENIVSTFPSLAPIIRLLKEILATGGSYFNQLLV